MREKIYKILNRVYGITLFVAFFGGVLPLVPFVIALIVGGSTGEAISTFLYNNYYPWVIALASVSVVIGLIAMYVGKQSAFSTKDYKKTK